MTVKVETRCRICARSLQNGVSFSSLHSFLSQSDLVACRQHTVSSVCWRPEIGRLEGAAVRMAVELQTVRWTGVSVN
jgi:hypothetical protein